MELFAIISFFLLGLVLGSFYNVVGIRLPQKVSFTNDRSRCPSCHHTLSWYDLIPVVSFFIQRGKCRYCGERISILYPIIELLTGILFAFSYMMIGIELELIKVLLLVSLSIIVLVTDLKYMLIPNKLLLFFLPFFIILLIIDPIQPWWSPIIGAIIGISLIALIIIISRGGMGAGDMKLFGLLGLVLGLEKVLMTFFLSCLLGAFIGVILMLFGIIKKKQPVPFGPYIVFAAIISYFFTDRILSFYVQFL
ncbi:prepilin peptidase [Ornithinibacillus sp. FSL M8-0202]|uniref:prepilin peptidase n=1 Tax=unclassified Ornithinibacillus TaxID=2620869 RepID=UPI0030CDA2E1